MSQRLQLPVHGLAGYDATVAKGETAIGPEGNASLTQIKNLAAGLQYVSNRGVKVGSLTEQQAHCMLHVVSVLLHLVVGEGVLASMEGMIAKAALENVSFYRAGHGCWVFARVGVEFERVGDFITAASTSSTDLGIDAIGGRRQCW